MVVGYKEDLEIDTLEENVILIWDLISSDNYIEYITCSSGTEYIAEDDGYVVVNYDKVKKSKGTSFSAISKTNGVYSSSYVSHDNSQVNISIPVPKNSIFIVNYDKAKPTWIRLFKAKKFIEEA